MWVEIYLRIIVWGSLMVHFQKELTHVEVKASSVDQGGQKGQLAPLGSVKSAFVPPINKKIVPPSEVKKPL